MIWNICFIISIAILLCSVFAALILTNKQKGNDVLSPFNVILGGVFVSVFTGMIPMFAVMLKDELFSVLKLVVFDVLQTIQVFTVNVGADLILDNINSSATALSGAYSTYMSALFFVAPILTFGFLISLFKNALGKIRFIIHYTKDIYAFSELNDKSLLLAQNIKENHKDAMIIFANVDRDEGDISSESIKAAEKLKAIIFKSDIITIDFMKHSKTSQLTFFAIDETESDNLIQSLKLIDKYRCRKNTSLYMFSVGAEGELLLANAEKGEIKVRRINEARSLIYRYLYDEGKTIFETAVGTNEGKKQIHALVLGLGKYGTEVLKALTWFSQMDGYSVKIDAFDKDELAEERFSALCPEIMSPEYNGRIIEGESEYTVTIHSDTDISTKKFADIISCLPEITFVFVCLGDDETNISQSANIRMLCERFGHKPSIKTVIYSTEKKDALTGASNYRGQPYNIDPVGDLETAYSEEILLGSELENLALERHLKWGREEEFWQYEYNYRSSMASAVHMKAKISCGISGAGKNEDDLTIEERDIIESLEHKRWNAYMRSEGYVYSGSPDKTSRNDLAKMHHDLVSFDNLTEEEKRKDSKVGTL